MFLMWRVALLCRWLPVQTKSNLQGLLVFANITSHFCENILSPRFFLIGSWHPMFLETTDLLVSSQTTIQNKINYESSSQILVGQDEVSCPNLQTVTYSPWKKNWASRPHRFSVGSIHTTINNSTASEFLEHGTKKLKLTTVSTIWKCVERSNNGRRLDMSNLINLLRGLYCKLESTAN